MPKIKLPQLPTIRPALPGDVPRHGSSGSSSTPASTRKGTPFFRDAAHTVPTKSLYRQILRQTRPAQHKNSVAGLDDGTEVYWSALRRQVKQDWKKRKGWTSIPQTTSFLNTQRTFLSTLQSPSPDLVSLSHKIHRRHQEADIRSTPLHPIKPYLAGYLRPTHNNPALPRLKPQPIQITLTIKSRIAARSRRLETQRKLYETENEMKSEAHFLRDPNLRSGSASKEGLEEVKGFMEEIKRRKDEIQSGYDRDERRRGGMFGIGVVRRVEEGKRRRQEWKKLKSVDGRGKMGVDDRRIA